MGQDQTSVPIFRVGGGLERTEQLPGDAGNLFYGRREGGLICPGWLVEAADFPDKLQGGRAYLFFRRRRLKVEQRPDASAHGQAAFSQLTIQGMPNRSTSIPKRMAQKVSWMGICTCPFSARALKIRSASAGSSTPSATQKPFVSDGCPGGLSEPMSTLSPTIRRAWMILLRHSEGTWSAMGESA